MQEAKNMQTAQNQIEKGSEERRTIRARQRAIGRELRRFYDNVAEEPVPSEFLELLKQIDEKSDPNGKGN